MNFRQKNNLLILDILREYFIQCEDLRFIQGLWACGIITVEDLFYEEPDVTLNKLIESIKNQNIKNR